MCGILVTTSPTSTSQHAWQAAMAVLLERGPDDAGNCDLAGTKLGHRRLEIIGLGVVGHQPYTHTADECALTFNGEIYNYLELAAELGISARSDTQVLFELLRREGSAGLSRLRGMYSFVFLDGRAERIIAARDPFGIKPLYTYLGANGELAFASVPSALALLHNVGDADPVSITGFLASGLFLEGTSPYARVHKSPPGVSIEYRKVAGRWREQSRQPIEITALPTEHPDVVAASLKDSIRAHLVADVPVGVLMSGGVDSTLLAALASAESPGINTYCLTNPNHPDIDEAKYARWNASLMGTNHTEVPAAPKDLAREMPRLITSNGEPFSDAAYLPLSVLCRRVSQDLKVVLAGEGADELFGGYRRYDIERWMFNRHTRVGVRAIGNLGMGRSRAQAGTPTQRTRTLEAWALGPGYLAHSQLIFGEWPTMLTALPQHSTSALKVHESSWQTAGSMLPAGSWPLNRYYDLCRWLPNVFLEKSDRASMLHSLEVRVPFLDRGVFSSAHALNPRDSRKQVLRELLHSTLPGVRLPPRKMGLSVATADVLSDGELWSQVQRQISASDSILVQSGLNKEGAQAIERRAQLNPAFAFRLATLDEWQNQWLN